MLIMDILSDILYNLGMTTDETSGKEEFSDIPVLISLEIQIAILVAYTACVGFIVFKTGKKWHFDKVASVFIMAYMMCFIDMVIEEVLRLKYEDND